MLQEAGPVEAVILRAIGYGTTHCGARSGLIVRVLPFHGEGSQVPARSTGHSGAVCICLLMTGRAGEGRHTIPRRTAHDVGKVTVAIVTLLRIVGGGVAVDARWVHEDRIHLGPCVQSLGAPGVTLRHPASRQAE